MLDGLAARTGPKAPPSAGKSSSKRERLDEMGSGFGLGAGGVVTGLAFFLPAAVRGLLTSFGLSGAGGGIGARASSKADDMSDNIKEARLLCFTKLQRGLDYWPTGGKKAHVSVFCNSSHFLPIEEGKESSSGRFPRRADMDGVAGLLLLLGDAIKGSSV